MTVRDEELAEIIDFEAARARRRAGETSASHLAAPPADGPFPRGSRFYDVAGVPVALIPARSRMVVIAYFPEPRPFSIDRLIRDGTPLDAETFRARATHQRP